MHFLPQAIYKMAVVKLKRQKYNQVDVPTLN